jgi:hypothetical protein
MKTSYLKHLVFFFFILNSLRVYSQGCSDAGFCTINAINPTTNHNDTAIVKNNYFKTGFSLGSAQFGVTVLTPYIEYDYTVSNKLLFSTKITYGLRTGKLATTADLSDVFLSLSYRVKQNWATVVGIKAPFNDGNLTKNRSDLPMSYQTSLGTVDFILGLSYQKNNFSASVGSQIPLTQNSNQFLPENFNDDVLDERYVSTYNYKRMSDVLLRLTYHHQFKNEKLKLIGGVLPIYHLANDKYTNPNGESLEIKNSQGLTLNLNAILQYQVGINQVLEFSTGAPVIARKSRPDGLSQFAIGIQYGIKF